MAFTETSRTGLHDQRGFTPLEALIAASAFLFILFAVYLVYEASRSTFARGETKTDIQQNARMALSTMERELRMAGYGVPGAMPPPGLSCPGTPLPRIVSASRRAITIRADLRNVLTTLAVQANAGASSLSLNPATATSGIAINDVLYITDGTNCETKTVATVGSGTLTLTTGLVNAYVGCGPPLSCGSQVFRPKDVTFNITGGQLTRDERNPGAAPSASPPVLAQKVKDQDTFRYFLADNVTEITANNPVADPTTIRRITITLSTSDTPPGLDLQSYPVQSDVRPRNL